MILAAVLGVVGGAGAASAQAPQPMPASPGAVPAVAAPIVVAPAHPAQVAPIQAPAPIAGGCCGSAAPTIASDSCGGCESSKGSKSRRGGLFHRASIGEGCANPIGCGSCASEKTFLFGGCNQFFNPGNKCSSVLGGGCGGGGLFGLCGRGDCAISPVGTGGLNSPPCTYTSYMNR
jgi:hypothetical protein